MNINNLRRVQLHGGKLVNSDTSHIAIHSAVSRAYGFSKPPTWEESDQFTPDSSSKSAEQREFVESDPASLPAVRSILALTGLDHATHTTNTDARLTPTGRAEKLAPIRTATVKTIAVAAHDLAAIGQAAHTNASAFYAPLKLPAGDTQAASEDREMRDFWKSSPLPKRTVLLQEMQGGEHERLLQALTRSPIALEKHEASLVQAAWLDRVAARDPKRHAAVQAALNNHDWATSVVKDSAKYAARSVGLSKLEMMDAAKGTGGEHLFSDANTIPANTPGQSVAPHAAA